MSQKNGSIQRVGRVVRSMVLHHWVGVQALAILTQPKAGGSHWAVPSGQSRAFIAYLLLLQREQTAFWYAGQGCRLQAAA